MPFRYPVLLTDWISCGTRLAAPGGHRQQEALCKPERVSIRIIHVKLTSAPGLVDRSFVDRGVGVARRDQPAGSELAEQRINIVCQDGDRLAEHPVSAVAGKEEVVPAAGDGAEGWVV